MASRYGASLLYFAYEGEVPNQGTSRGAGRVPKNGQIMNGYCY